jgi:hypothetical protein
MSSIEQCIRQLDAVREAAVDPRAAYVIRSRLERLLLSCARLTSDLRGSAKPDMPRHIGVSAADSSDVRKIAAVCNALHDLTGSICRPSESLDVRWDEGWARISAALDELESVLHSQPQPAQ